MSLKASEKAALIGGFQQLLPPTDGEGYYMASGMVLPSQPEGYFCIFERLKNLEVITLDDLHGFGRKEFYAVIVEHWVRCCPQVKSWLLQHSDAFIAENAKAVSDAMA